MYDVPLHRFLPKTLRAAGCLTAPPRKTSLASRPSRLFFYVQVRGAVFGEALVWSACIESGTKVRILVYRASQISAYGCAQNRLKGYLDTRRAPPAQPLATIRLEPYTARQLLSSPYAKFVTSIAGAFPWCYISRQPGPMTVGARPLRVIPSQACSRVSNDRSQTTPPGTLGVSSLTDDILSSGDRRPDISYAQTACGYPRGSNDRS